jgi:hypothetical protein
MYQELRDPRPVMHPIHFRKKLFTFPFQMVIYTTEILQFGEQGEKTGWTYITVPEQIAQQLMPGNKKSFRVKGRLDDQPIAGVALLPMGGGNFIMALNSAIRKKIKKRKGAKLRVQLEPDKNTPQLPADFMECLSDEPRAKEFFKSLSKSHQNYYGAWISTAKMEATRVKRIAQAINALNRGLHFGLMLRSLKADREDRLP